MSSDGDHNSQIDSNLDVPAIRVTNSSSTSHIPDIDLALPDSPRHEDHVPSPQSSSSLHSRSPSDPNFLLPSPILKPPTSAGRLSLDVPISLTHSGYASSDVGSPPAPPSPTLSTRSSVQFAPNTSLALRENRPDQHSGISSLQLLTAGGSGHSRKGSVASSMEGSTEGTEPDSHSNGLSPPYRSEASFLISPSPTHTQFDVASSFGGTTVRSPSRSANGAADGKADGGDEPPEQRPALDLSQDELIDSGAFPFKPYSLASLVDPKNLPGLIEMGGTKGLLRGLGTHAKTGLSKKSLTNSDGSTALHAHHQDGDGRPGTGTQAGAGDGASHRHAPHPSGGGGGDDVPGIVVTSADGVAKGDTVVAEHDAADDENEEQGGAAYDAPLDERQRVFGENVLPTRKTKSLLQLMWLALGDKVLVRASGLSVTCPGA